MADTAFGCIDGVLSDGLFCCGTGDRCDDGSVCVTVCAASACGVGIGTAIWGEIDGASGDSAPCGAVWCDIARRCRQGRRDPMSERVALVWCVTRANGCAVL